MQQVGGYDWLYGSVGGVLGFMLWAWVSARVMQFWHGGLSLSAGG